jgi:threonylcarbamoyladenosine tRNA methylthiotransferase MtaB
MALEKTFFIKSMGCKSNQFEGDLISKNLEENGYKRVFNASNCDYFVLNSCSVTHKSDAETLYILRNAKHKNPNVKTVLTGCVAQIEKENLLSNSYIDYVFGNDDKFRLSDLLLGNDSAVVSDIMSLDKFNYQVLEDTTKTRFSLKIQDGCNNRCSYCIIPFARGKSRSANSDFVVNQINNAVEHGYKEVIFTGIHIGQWGIDFQKNLLDLLIEVEEKSRISRFRLGSLNPLEITSELLSFLVKSEKFCPHFHLSLQSACNKTLRAMNRFYTVEKYLEQIDNIVENFNNPFLGADIITGFVGETDSDFETTVDNLKKSKLSKIHTFPYSIRKGTAAENMEGHLPSNIKQERAEIVKKISNQKYDEFLTSNLDSIQEVLIEKNPDKHLNMLKGVTRNYLPVYISNRTPSNEYFNTLHKIKIEKADAVSIYGSIID